MKVQTFNLSFEIFLSVKFRVIVGRREGVELPKFFFSRNSGVFSRGLETFQITLLMSEPGVDNF